ncbi:MAG: DSD1 family PLP-dependent enzyme [Acidobacteria bacterium]|nr:DSD1 family PLP-dependent enzyme [Acidobacteriota bacterium]
MSGKNHGRRKFLKSSLAGFSGLAAGPLLLSGKPPQGYTQSEAEKILGQGANLEGLSKHDLCTPALLLDLDLFEANLRRMARHAKRAGVNLRPHAKTHKCPEIARRQVRAGAVGLCVANIGEAEVMGAAGIPGILITSELVGKHKIERFVRLARQHSDIAAVVDHPENIRHLNQAAGAARKKLNVFLDIDVGSRRTGVAPGDPALRLALAVANNSGLILRGIHAYAGHASHTMGFENRRARSREAMTEALETKALLEKNGIEVGLVSGGSTGTYNIDSEMKGISELQVGSYVFMDLDYRRIGGRSGASYDDFACALTVMTTVISKPEKHRAVVEGGYKAFAADRPFTPELKTVGGVRFSWGGDEHGKLDLTNAEREIRLGDRLEFIVPHCDPNANLYDRLYGIRGEKVEAVWPIAARGYRL